MWNQLIINKFSKNLKIDKVKIKEDILKNNIQKNYLLSEIVFDLENESLDQKYSKIKRKLIRMDLKMLHQPTVYQIVQKMVEN